jgi:hypothetical protein
MFETWSACCQVRIGHKHDCHGPVANVTAYQKGVKVSNKLPLKNEQLFTNCKQLKQALN